MQRIGLWKQRDLHGAEIWLEKASDFDSRLNASRPRPRHSRPRPRPRHSRPRPTPKPLATRPRPRPMISRPRPRLSKYGLETSQDQDSSLENSMSGRKVKTKTKTHDLKTKTKTFEIRSQDVSRPRLKSRELHVWKAYRRRYGQDCEQTHSDPVVVQVVSKLLTLTSYCSSPIMRNSVVKDLREDRLSAVDSSVIHWRQNQNM